MVNKLLRDHLLLAFCSSNPIQHSFPRQPPLLDTLQHGIMVLLFPSDPDMQSVNAVASHLPLTRKSIRWFKLEGRSLLCLEMMAQSTVLMAQVFSRTIKQNLWDLPSFYNLVQHSDNCPFIVFYEPWGKFTFKKFFFALPIYVEFK